MIVWYSKYIFYPLRRIKSPFLKYSSGIHDTVSCRETAYIAGADKNRLSQDWIHSLCFMVVVEPCQLTPPQSKAPRCCAVLRCSELHSSYLLPTDSPAVPRTCCFVSSQEHWSREDWALVLLDRENHSAQQVYLWYICQRCLVCVCFCEFVRFFSVFEAFSHGV